MASPVVEIGAGRGYWAGLARGEGGVVDAYDISHARGRGVRHGGELAAGMYGPEWSLFLCWPPLQSEMASRALEKFRGERLLYVGEARGGCTGDERFHQMLEDDWMAVRRVGIPRWEGIHDSMHVFRRKEPAGACRARRRDK